MMNPVDATISRNNDNFIADDSFIRIKNEIETGLNNLTKAFKKYLAPQLHLRVTPDLQFINDETLEYSEKIEELIKSIKDKEKNDN